MRASCDLRGCTTRSLPVVTRKSGERAFCFFFCPPAPERSFFFEARKKNSGNDTIQVQYKLYSLHARWPVSSIFFCSPPPTKCCFYTRGRIMFIIFLCNLSDFLFINIRSFFYPKNKIKKPLTHHPSLSLSNTQRERPHPLQAWWLTPHLKKSAA